MSFLGRPKHLKWMPGRLVLRPDWDAVAFNICTRQQVFEIVRLSDMVITQSMRCAYPPKPQADD